ncbi:tRNA lysidine(34) synthetase TilS [Chitinimonas naiadis]
MAVAYSGGLDSSVLLALFLRLRTEQPLQLQAFHLHHGLSPSADDWLAHCADYCLRHGIAFSHEKAGLDASAPDSLEARARSARYAAFARLDAELVALAHHRDDQAETVLYRLARGTGVHGAAGMPSARPLAEGKRIWRPLLAESREQLHNYALVQGLQWVEDESNASIEYDRNYLRQQVIPALLTRFPSAQSAIARAARHFAETASLLDAIAEQDAGVWTPRLSLARLRDLAGPRQRNLLRWFLAGHDMRPDERQLVLLLEQLLTAREDANPCLRLGERAVHRYRDEIWLAHWVAEPPDRPVAGEGRLTLPGWQGELVWMSRPGGLVAEALTGLWARPRRGGESLRPRQGGPNRPVKLLLQEAGIPPWLRTRWPLLWQGENLVAVAGIATAAEFQAKDEGSWPAWRPQDWPDFQG